MNKVLNVIFLAFAISFLSSVPASAEPGKHNKELDNIRQAIKDKRAKWTAGENNRSRMSPEERKRTLGMAPPRLPKEQRSAAPEYIGLLTAPSPGTLDWRSRNGNYVTGIRSQGACGGCWAFGSLGALESKALITLNTPGIDLDLSEQVLVSCSGAGTCNGGWLLKSYFTDTGAPAESCYPYTETDGDCANACANWQLSTYKTTGYTTIVQSPTAQTVQMLKDGVARYGPIVASMAVYSDFDYYSGGIYQHVTGYLEGYHAITIVGYDDLNSCFIVKNSWSEFWGEDGYFRIAYTELDGVVDFGYEAVAYGAVIPPYFASVISSPMDNDYLNGASATITGAASPDPGNTVQEVYVSTDGGASWNPATGTTNWSYAWTLPADGTYSIKSKARDGLGNFETPLAGITVTIDNTLPSSTISYPANGASIGSAGCTITGTATDGAGTGVEKVEVSTDGGATWSTATGTDNWSYDWPSSSAGSYNIKTRATDNTGNAETPGAGITVNVIWPTSTITSPANGATMHGVSATIAGTAAESSGVGLMKVEVSTDGGATWNIAAGTTNWTYEWTLPTEEANYNIRSKATDANSNPETPGAGISVLVDNLGPDGLSHGSLWAHQKGTVNLDRCKAVVTDAQDNTYTAGSVTGSCDGNTAYGSSDIFIIKYDPSGTKLWSRQLGSTVTDGCGRMSADSYGNIYVVGYTEGSFDGNTNYGDADVILVKYGSDGTKKWSRQFGTSTRDIGICVTTDAGGNVYAGGSTYGVMDGTSKGDYDLFIAKFDSGGTRQWTRQAGSIYLDGALGITCDANGNVYATGSSYFSFDGQSRIGNEDIVLIKYDSNGNKLWSRQTGTTSDEYGGDAVCDTSGNVYVTGKTWGTLTGCTRAGGYDCFLMKYDQSGNLLWTKQEGTSGNEAGNGVAADPDGNIYVCGDTQGGMDGVNAGGYDAFVARFDSSGSRIWTHQAGTSADDLCNAVALGPGGIIAVSGETSGSFNEPVAGNSDIFTLRITQYPLTVQYGARAVITGSVVLNFSVKDASAVSQMRISNDGVFDSESWQSYSASKAWTLLPGDGEKTVYAQFKDSLGNESGVFSDTIWLDGVSPSSAITAPAAGSTVIGTSYTITGTANDGSGSGIAKVEVSTDGGSTWYPASGTDSWTYSWALPADGSYTLKSRATDIAYNTESAGPGVSVTVESSIPSSWITGPLDNARLKQTLVTISGTASDTGSGVQSVFVSTDGGGSWSLASGTGSWSYDWPPPADGRYNLKCKAVDAAGNSETPGAGITVDIDNSGPAVQDIVWSRQLGTASWDYGNAVAADSLGNLYVSGYTGGGLDGNTSAGSGDFFLTKYGPGGEKLWTRQAGNAYNETTGYVAVDASDNPYLTGSTPGNLNGQTNANTGINDIFIIKYDQAGTAQWTRLFGSTSSDGSGRPSADLCGNIYIPGSTSGSLEGANAGNTDVVLYKYGPDGTKIWGRQTGSTSSDTGSSTKVDAAGNIYVAGYTQGGLHGNVSAGSTDIFMMKYDNDGNRLWTRQFGTASVDEACDIALDGRSGCLYLAGRTYGSLDGNTSAGNYDVFVTKYTLDGVKLWTRQFGSDNWDAANSIAVDSCGDIIVVGLTYGSMPGYVNAGQCDVFSAKFDPDGNRLWIKQKGTAYSDYGYGVALGANGNIAVCGAVQGEFEGNPSSGLADMFVDEMPTFPVSVNSNSKYTNTSAVTLDFYVSDPSGVSQLQLSNDGVFDDEPWEPHAAAKVWTLAAGAGPRTAYARFQDTLGNISEVFSDEITVDIAAPDSAIIPPDGNLIGRNCTINGTAADDGEIREVEVSTDGGATWTSARGTADWSLNWNVPAVGVYTIMSRATDVAGNVEAEPDSITVNATCTPASAITAPAAESILSGSSYAITGTASDLWSTVQKVDVSTDGGSSWVLAAGTASWSYSWSLPADGEYTISSRAEDDLANVETPDAGITVYVDNLPPASVITSPQNGNFFYGSIVIRGTSSDAGTSVQQVEVSTDGGATWSIATGTSSWSYDWTPGVPGTYTVLVRGADASGHLETPGAGITVNALDEGSPELPHYNWNAAMIPSGTDCAYCHSAPDRFMAADFRGLPGFCYSCHNAAGTGHELNLTGSPGQHTLFVNATAAGRRRPTYGNITAGETNNIPASRLKGGYQVTCITCHNGMQKTDDPGRSWEYTTTSDRYKYYLQAGGWSGYGNLSPKVYRDTSLWSGPTYSKSRKDYLVDPSEYAYNEMSGIISFKAQQASTSYIYATLYYPYLRAPMQDNALCSDCHTEATHRDINCLNCHRAHNTGNLKGIREKVRANNSTTVPVKFLNNTGANSFADGDTTYDGICEVCHTQTRYYRRDGTGFVNHSGGFNYTGKACTNCHGHSDGFGR